MATRPSRAAQAARTAPEPAAPVASPATNSIAVPDAWGDVEVFAGHDLTEKKELVGVPFCILGVEIERNEERGYDTAYVYAMDVNGTQFEFADSSSTGVRAQLQAYMADKGFPPHAGAGHVAFRLAVMKGLRVSEFKFTDQETGKKRDAAVFYLTAGMPAQKPAAAPAEAPASDPVVTA